jgi:hypothetical protein
VHRQVIRTESTCQGNPYALRDPTLPAVAFPSVAELGVVALCALVCLFEIGKTYQLPNGPQQPYLPGDLAGGIIVKTIFGPVEVAGAVGDYGRSKFFFRIGRVF